MPQKTRAFGNCESSHLTHAVILQTVARHHMYYSVSMTDTNPVLHQLGTNAAKCTNQTMARSKRKQAVNTRNYSYKVQLNTELKDLDDANKKC